LHFNMFFMWTSYRKMEKKMNVDNIDREIAAAVLRRQQQIGMEHAAEVMAKRLREQNVPEFLIERVTSYTEKLMADSAPDLDLIMKEFESGSIEFDDTVLKVMQFSLDLSKSSAKDIDEIIHQSIVSGELEKYYNELNKEDSDAASGAGSRWSHCGN